MVKLLQVGATVTAQVDTQKRRHIAPNHSMTHVLNHALRDVLCGNPNSSAGMSVSLCMFVYGKSVHCASYVWQVKWISADRWFLPRNCVSISHGLVL